MQNKEFESQIKQQNRNDTAVIKFPKNRKISQNNSQNKCNIDNISINYAKNQISLKSNLDVENVKMQAWIKALFTVYPSLPNIVSVIDNIVMQRASSIVPYSQIYNGSVSTYSEIEKVIDMTDRKNKILNIVALVREIISELSMAEYEVVDMKFFRRMKTSTIADKLLLDERSVFRRLKKVVEHSSQIALALGYDSSKIEKIIKGESWIKEIYSKSKCELESNKVRSQKNMKKITL